MSSTSTGDGNFEVVFHQFLHNGTVVSIDVRAVLEVDADQTLHETLRIHERSEKVPLGSEWGTQYRTHARPLGGDPTLLLVDEWWISDSGPFRRHEIARQAFRYRESLDPDGMPVARTWQVESRAS